MSNEDKLKDILEGDYKFVLISGNYFDCPSCNPDASLSASTFYDEKDLLKHILEHVNHDRMEAIWLIDHYGDGDMVKYCDIETRTGFHNVRALKFKLPQKGIVLIHQEEGQWKVADPAYLLLYEKELSEKEV